MKIVIAPDSFKGSLTAKEVGAAIEKGLKKVFGGDIEINIVPMADGGEGTLQCLVDASGGCIVSAKVLNPLGKEIDSFFGVLGDKRTCVIETAVASGLYLIDERERNPLLTTTFGVGQLIRAGLDYGCRRFIIALGGSATNDGGAGMLQALGVDLLDCSGKPLGFGGAELSRLSEIRTDQMDSRLRESEFTIACDVDNPFIGPKGASHVFGPQKGATPAMAEQLDQSLRHFANRIESTLGISIHHVPGAGAAGGLAGAIYAFLNGKIDSGINIVIQMTGLEKEIKNTDLVITGEGQIDFQTAHGKTPSGVARVAKKYGVPVIAIAGSIGNGIDSLYEMGIKCIFSIIDKPMSLREAMLNASELITKTAEQIARLYQIRENQNIRRSNPVNNIQQRRTGTPNRFSGCCHKPSAHD